MKYRIFYTIVFTILLSVSVVYNGCGGIFVNIRYFTEIIIIIVVKMMCVDHPIFKNTGLHTKQSIVLNILIAMKIVRQVALF